jgi:hypothetical protein
VVTTTLTMYDSIDPTQFHGLPMDAAAGYVDGKFQTFPTLREHVPPGTTLMSISVFGNPADCIDIEAGDVGAAGGAAWVAARLAAGHRRPVVYTAASNIRNVLGELAAVGVARGETRVWSAHYGIGEHICSPAVCGFPAADGTQWTDAAHGRNLDQSALLVGFFKPPAPKPKPAPAQIPEDLSMLVVFGTDAKAGLPMPNGVTHLRITCSQGATVGVTWAGTTTPTRNVNVDFNHRADMAIPRDQTGTVVLTLVKGTEPVYATWLVPE